MLYVKVGTGVGCGIISGRGAVHRGAQGAAGDIGHIQVPGHEDVPCRCGNAGCLEAVAGGRALAQRLHVDAALAPAPGTWSGWSEPATARRHGPCGKRVASSGPCSRAA